MIDPDTTSITVLAERYPAVQELLVDRDRLRRQVETERTIHIGAGCPDCGVHEGCHRVAAERDRLRSELVDLRQLIEDSARKVLAVARADDAEDPAVRRLRGFMGEPEGT